MPHLLHHYHSMDRCSNRGIHLNKGYINPQILQNSHWDVMHLLTKRIETNMNEILCDYSHEVTLYVYTFVAGIRKIST